MKKILSQAFKLLAVSFIVFSATSCDKNTKNDETSLTSEIAASKVDTITNLNQYNGVKAVWLKDGQYITVENVPYSAEELQHDADEKRNEERDNTEEKKELNKTAACSDAFDGTARKAAKLSFAAVSYTTYSTITALRSSMYTDAYMRGLGISSASTSNRVTQEKKNVSITTSYLYAISRESDEDFHLIIGNSTSASSLINVEVSGNPPSSQSSYSAINATRNVIKSYFGKDFCGQSGYTKFTPAIRIYTLTGSMFFDVDHGAGTVGPTGLRPNSSWEIHPVKSISF
jgi:hypothetical protein